MKNLVFSAVFLLSIGAWACPQITGTYKCDYQGDIKEMIVTQRTTGGVTTYMIGGEEYIADGQDHAVNTSGLVGKYKATCGDNTVTAKLDAVYQNQITIDLNSVFTKGANGNVTIATKGRYFGEGVNEPVDELTPCTKQ